MEKKVKFTDITPQYVSSNGRGFEVNIEDGRFHFCKEMNIDEKNSVRNYIKGLKILFKRASEKRTFDNSNNNIIEKYNTFLNLLKKEDIITIGSKLKELQLTAYVDGSWTYILK